MNHGHHDPMWTIVALSSLAVFSGCRSDLHTLQTWMTGEFSSADQALADPNNYHDIRLYMVPIWKQRPDGPWLYVEQAAAQALERPYRQRVYHLRANNDGTLESVVYALPGDPLRFAGACENPGVLDELSPDDIVLRDGCSITLLESEDGTFIGGTTGKGCESTLRGASYATSVVVIDANQLTSWDCGFDADDQQVWGATEGAYVFIRTAPPHPGL